MPPENLNETTALHTEQLVLALISVDGAMSACATHGDAATVPVLSAYYALVAAMVEQAGGRVVKVMGDGILAVFPMTLASAAVSACRGAQVGATNLWRAFDTRCRAGVRMSAGTVISGQFGPPGEERADLFGNALNQLFRASGGEFVLLPELEALLV